MSPGRFVLDSVRMAWRWMTRMRTALWMLLWLGVLTAVATVVPQAPNVPSTVERWLAGEEGPGVGVPADCPVWSPDVCEKTATALVPVRPRAVAGRG